MRDASPDVHVSCYAVGITDWEALKRTLGKVEEQGRLDSMRLNAASVEPGTLLETPTEDVMKDFQVRARFLGSVSCCVREWLWDHTKGKVYGSTCE